MDHVAVFDIGKTTVKLSVATSAGAIIETVTAANDPLPGPPYLHPDAKAIEGWFFDQLRVLTLRHRIAVVVVTTHGSLGALVGGGRLAMPMIDYEHEPPPEFNCRYRDLVDPLEQRGSPVMPGLAHLARQLLFLETEWPDAVERAEHFLGGPQYWSWLLTGVAASELTYLGAQSHLWDVHRKCFLGIVGSRGWRRLLPPLKPAWQILGAIRPELAARHALPEGIAVLCGIHDSSANFYRYQQAGLTDAAVVSTGTWIVGLGPDAGPAAFGVSEKRQCNADIHGSPVAGVLAMGGREFAALAGDAIDRRAELSDVAILVAAGTMALPTFAAHDVLFPGSAGRGRIVGPQPASPAGRRALATLYAALLTDACLRAMGEYATAVLDGAFVSDRLYPALVAALRPGSRVLCDTHPYGTAAGAALLAGHGARSRPVAVDLNPPAPADVSGLAAYATRWHSAATGNTRVSTKRP